MNLQRFLVSSPLRIAPARAGFALSGMMALAVVPAQAVEFDLKDGDISGSLDTTISYGTMWRVQGQDHNNDGINSNDGNRNYDTGIVSQVFKITSDLEMNWENYGMFVRGTAFYDAEMNGSTHYGKASWQANQPSQAQGEGKEANHFTSDAKDISGKDAQILDAYMYGSWDIMEKPVDARFGKQVLSWGEGIFYRNGINTTNPIDAAKFRLPGSELKEALIPVETFSLSVGLTDNLSADLFYQYNFRKTQIDPVGTFFSETDLFAEGGNTAYTSSTALAAGTQGYAALTPAQLAAFGSHGISGDVNTAYAADGITQVARIGGDIDASDDGQFGTSFRYIAEQLNDTEFGFYFINSHGKEPLLYASLDENFQTVNIAGLMGLGLSQAAAGGLATVELLNNVDANRKYLEDIRTYGFSFSTTYGNTSFAGEVAYRPNMPVSISTTDDLIGDIAAQGATIAAGGSGRIAGSSAAIGSEINNYERVESWNLSLSAIHNFGPSLSFDSLFGIVEVSSEHLRGSSLTYTAHNGTRDFSGRGDCAYVNFADGECNEADQVSRNAWGYTAVLAGSWNDVYAGVTLNPYLRWSQDIEGNSHRTGNFLEGANSMTIGMTAQYLEIEGEIQYTEFTGPSTYSQRDRDNISIGVKYSF